MQISEIRTHGSKVFLTLLLVFLTGCASSYKDFKASNVGEDEGVVVGKVSVVFNGEPYNINLCEFGIGSTFHDLLDEGYVFMPLKSGETQSSVSLKCHYTGGQGDHTHTFNINPQEVKPGVTYFGSLHFSVDEVLTNQLTADMVLPKKRYSGRAGMLGVVGVLLLRERAPIQVAAAKLLVKDELRPVMEAFQRQAGDGTVQVETNLVVVAGPI
ncbi:MAG: hypothetical protein OEZ51_12165 [Nitrospinota bacterium]|nr:hypothetical protein [Nitrospinota bacterium]